MDTGSIPVVIYADLPIWHRLSDSIRMARDAGHIVIEVQVSGDIAEELITDLESLGSNCAVAAVEIDNTELKVLRSDETEIVRLVGFEDDSIDFYFPLDF